MSYSQEPLNRREFLNLLYFKSSQWVKDCLKPFVSTKPLVSQPKSPSETEAPLASFRDSL